MGRRDAGMVGVAVVVALITSSLGESGYFCSPYCTRYPGTRVHVLPGKTYPRPPYLCAIAPAQIKNRIDVQ